MIIPLIIYLVSAFGAWFGVRYMCKQEARHPFWGEVALVFIPIVNLVATIVAFGIIISDMLEDFWDKRGGFKRWFFRL